MRFLERLRTPVIPVVVIDDAALAVPLARALAAGGLDTIEVTLRTPAGVDAIRRIAAEVPQVQVGAGTLTRAGEIGPVLDAGARFAFAPGFRADVVRAAREAGLDYVPGVMTPSEATAARDDGCRWLKLFPAEQAGGAAMLRALAGPFPELRFCPTGGVDAQRAAAYLALPSVFAVGGSWMVPPQAIAERAWASIEALAREAARLAPARTPENRSPP